MILVLLSKQLYSFVPSLLDTHNTLFTKIRDHLVYRKNVGVLQINAPKFKLTEVTTDRVKNVDTVRNLNKELESTKEGKSQVNIDLFIDTFYFSSTNIPSQPKLSTQFLFHDFFQESMSDLKIAYMLTYP